MSDLRFSREKEPWFFFDHEDGAYMFLRNVGLSPKNTALESRRPYSLTLFFVYARGNLDEFFIYKIP
jgi:hypothetical protein